MMRKRFYTLERIEEPLPDAYLVNPSGRFVWLQRLAHSVLKRWGAHVISRTSAVREIEVPPAKDIVQDLEKEITARIAYGARQEDMIIIVGADAYRGIQLALAGEAPLWHSEYNPRLDKNDRRIFGIPVYVTDWFDGTIVLPKRAIQ